MSTTRFSPKQRFALIALLMVFIALIVGGGLALRAYAPGNMGNGFLGGAGVAVIAASIAGWRSLRHPQRATTLERGWTQTGDERDDAVLTRALAVLGLLSLPLVGIATLLIGSGVSELPVLVLLNGALIATFAVAYSVVDRRS